MKTPWQSANCDTWIEKPMLRIPEYRLLHADVMRKILIVLVLLRNWKFTLVDNTGPTATEAAVIIKSDQFANNKRTWFLEYQNTITL